MWLLKYCTLHNVIFEMENFRNGIVYIPLKHINDINKLYNL